MIRTTLVALFACLTLFGTHAWRSRSSDAGTLPPSQGGSLQSLMRTSHIIPGSPFANNVLRINMLQATAIDYEAIAVTWFRNGQEIEAYSATELSPDYFQKGDQVEADVRVRAPGGDPVIEPVATNVVFVSNTPPQIIESSVDIGRNGSDYLFARVNAVDADNDPLEYSYAWLKNGVEVPDVYGETFDLSRCQSGDEVQVLIVAWDGEVESAVSRSEAIAIGSTAPIITSTPPQSVAERKFVYKVDTVSRESMALHYELLQAPTGMTVSEDGLIAWSMPDPEEGTQQYDVVVRVTSASGGEAYQDFSISVEGTR